MLVISWIFPDTVHHPGILILSNGFIGFVNFKIAKIPDIDPIRYFCILCQFQAFKIFSRKCPVYDSFTFTTFSGVPCATIIPPLVPPSGPRSIM